jgi:signal transduction histidine kinase
MDEQSAALENWGKSRQIAEIIGLLALCLGITLLTPQNIEDKFTDIKFRFWQEPAQDSPFVILEIKEEDFLKWKPRYSDENSRIQDRPLSPNRFERPQDVFLWNKNLYKEVMQRLSEAGTRVILWTMYFPETLVHLGDDQEFKDLARANTTVWSSRFDSEGNFLLPPLDLTPSGNFGYNNLFPDSDGVLRKFSLIESHQLALVARLFYVLHGHFDGLPNPHEDQTVYWTQKPGEIPHCSLNEFLNSELRWQTPCRNLENKIVLIGRGGKGARRYITPLGGMNRSEILAQQMETILSKGGIRKAPDWWLPLASLLLVLFAAFSALLLPPYGTILAVLSLNAVSLAINFLTFEIWKVNLPATFVFPALILTSFIFLLYRVSIEAQLRWRTQQQILLNKEIEELRVNFMSLISHDLKTPIAKIQALSERLLRKKESKEEKEWLQGILKSNDELRQYIQGILSFSKVEANKMKLTKTRGDLNQVIQEVLKRHAWDAEDKNVDLQFEEEPLFTLEFDEELIRQVISNLMDNALKFSPDGGRVRVRTWEEQDRVWVSIEDNGPGIPETESNRIFDKFARISEKPYTEKKGSGLGLYLTKYFLKLHGGDISYRKPESGKGSEFVFWLPIE